MLYEFKVYFLELIGRLMEESSIVNFIILSFGLVGSFLVVIFVIMAIILMIAAVFDC